MGLGLNGGISAKPPFKNSTTWKDSIPAEDGGFIVGEKKFLISLNVPTNEENTPLSLSIMLYVRIL